VRAGLSDPVLDTDFLNVSYRDTKSLFRDLTQLGARNSLAGRSRSLTGKQRFQAMEGQLNDQFKDGLLELRLEVVYGHAWGGGPPAGPCSPAGNIASTPPTSVADSPSRNAGQHIY
jgi:malonyl-CoA O-methyltransferase